jgi:hypothetical protein
MADEENMDEVEELEEDMVELEDGSVIVPDPDDVDEAREYIHDENLAEFISESKLSSIASELCDLIDKDKEARKDRDMQYEEGIKRTGLGKEAPGGADFEGASDVVHPVLAEACVDYASAAIKEIFPPDGPVKMHYLSTNSDPAQIEKAENKRDFLNWQLTKQIVEYRSDLEVLLTQQPLGGSQYLKFFYDDSKKRICCEFVPIDKVYLPFSASSFLSAQRFTIVDTITQYELERRTKSGFYRDLNLYPASLMPDETDAERASDKVEGKTESGENVDGDRNIYEVYCYFEVEDDEESLPYIITIDALEERILSIYRNWDMEDLSRQRLEWVVEFPFIPWRGAQGIGLTHLIGSLSAAATGSLRALLDSALINNFPGAIKLKGGKSSGETIRVGPTEIIELEAPASTDDIRKLIMPMPYNQPSGVLFQLLGFVVEAARGVVATADEKIADATNQMPVGTTMALIEQGSKVFSAIHARQHAAQARVLEIIHRLNATYFDEEAQVKAFGRILVTREDFLSTNNVVPVSDPNIFSESQRFAQIQGVLQMAQDQSVQWNKHNIYTRLLRLMHVEAPQEFLPPIPQPVSADPITEIIAAMTGQQIQATPDMDHMMHMKEELIYLLDPVFGAANPTLMNPGFQMIMQDVNQHLILLFQQMKVMSYNQATQQVQSELVQRLSQMPITEEQMQMFMQQQMSQPNVQNYIMQMSAQIFEQQKASLQQLIQMQQQAAELVKTKVPPPQLDPQSQAALQIAQLQEQNKTQISQLQEQGKMQIASIKDQNEKMELAMKEKIESMKLELDSLVETQIKPQLETIKNQTELLKNREDNEQKQTTELSKNNDDNQTQILINELRNESATERAILIEEMRQMFENMRQRNSGDDNG